MKNPPPLGESIVDNEPALKASYVDLDTHALEAAAVRLSEVLVRQIRELHSAYALARSLENDLFAAEVVRGRRGGLEEEEAR